MNTEYAVWHVSAIPRDMLINALTNGCEWPLSDKLVNEHKRRSDRWKKYNFPLTEFDMNYCSIHNNLLFAVTNQVKIENVGNKWR